MSMDEKSRKETLNDIRDKRESAMRLFEAFSGVDEKYLDACEKAGQSKPKVVPFAKLAGFNRRYGSYVAAALVLFVIGAGVIRWSSMQLGSTSAPSAMQADNAVMMEEAQAVVPAAEADVESERGKLEGQSEQNASKNVRGETNDSYVSGTYGNGYANGKTEAVGNVADASAAANTPSAANESSGVATNVQSGRMVMAGGQLYVDTGYVSGIWGRCGTLDGTIESVIESGQTPTKDGQANFKADGWQVGSEKDTIEVPIDDEWCIFAVVGSKPKGYIPASVLQFMATVEEVTTDGYIIVKTNLGIGELFRGKIREDTLYKVSLEQYDQGTYTGIPEAGNVVVIVCKNKLEETEPQLIAEVYRISPVGSNVMQRAE